MDIHDKLLETVNPNDPKFKVFLNNAIQAEITSLEEELKVKKVISEQKKKELSDVLERRKLLKENIKRNSKLVDTMKRATCCLQDYSKYMIEKVETTKNMLDEDSLQKLSMIKETEKLKDKYEKMWIEYESEFEKAPLANERRAAKEEFQKLEIMHMITKMDIKAMEKNHRAYEKIKERKLQMEIVALAEVWINHRKNVENLKKLRQEDAQLKLKISEQERQIEVFIKEKADKEKQEAMARFRMPPPVMDKKRLETIFCQPQFSQSASQTPEKHRDLQTSSYCDSPDDYDTVSISSSVFEEMCTISGKKNPAETQSVGQVEIEPDVISIISSQNNEFEGEESPEKRPDCGLRQTKKLEMAKRPANSPEESPVRKKNKDDISTSRTKPKQNKSQEKTPISLNTIKSIQENVRKQDRTTGVPVGNVQSEIIEMEKLSSSNSTLMNSPNHSIAGSVNSSCNESNVNQKGFDSDFNSDLSIQSNLNDQNNSINFSVDEMSDARSDINLNEGNVANTDPPAAAPTGMFGSQKKRFLNFQGLFFK